MDKIKITVRRKDKNGKYVFFSDIDYGTLAPRSISNYLNIIKRLNKEQGLAEDKFYWELFCKDKIIEKIILIAHQKYKISDGSQLTTKISPILSLLNRINVPPYCVAKWTSLIGLYQKEEKYQELIEHLHITPAEKTKAPTPMEWKELKAIFQKISEDTKQDARLRILCTIYKYGYVLRIGSIYKTKFKTTTEDDEYNVLDLNSCKWNIIKSKSWIQSFAVHQGLCKEIKDIMKDKKHYFTAGWLLPKANGLPYSATSSLSTFMPWRNNNLPTNAQCRKSFETWHWYKTDGDAETARSMSMILDHTPRIAILHYTPPYEL